MRVFHFALATLFLASSAHAQMTGTRFGRNADSRDSKAVFDVMVNCVGQRQPAYAHDIMKLAPGTRAENERIFGNSGDLGMCLDDKSRKLMLPDNVEMRFTARTFRIALARVLAVEGIKGLNEQQVARLIEAPEWSPNLYAPVSEGAEVDQIQTGLFYFGDCLIAAMPTEAVRYLRFGSGSAEGAAAMQAMVPAMGPCIPEGGQLNVTPTALDVALAEPLYHRARVVVAKWDREDR